MIEKIIEKRNSFKEFYKIFIKKNTKENISSNSSFLNTILSYLSFRKLKKRTFFITYSPLAAKNQYEILEKVFNFPQDIIVLQPEKEHFYSTLNEIYTKKEEQFIILPFELLFSYIPTKKEIAQNSFIFSIDKIINRNNLIKFLIKNNYKKNELIWQKGDFSIRGDIIDIYPQTENLPIRIEMFDEKIEKIYYFNTETQETIKDLNHFVLFNREFSFNREKQFLELITKNDLIILNSIELIKKRIAFLRANSDYELPLDPIDKVEMLTEYRNLIKIYEFFPTKNIEFSINITTLNTLYNNVRLFSEYFYNWISKNYTIIYFIKNKHRITKLKQIINQHLKELKQNPKIIFISKEIYQNFIWEDEKIVFISEKEFKKTGETQLTTNFPKYFEKELSNIQEGDYVVHEEYGIGRFLGIENKKIANILGDYFVIEYRNNEKLYLPVERLDKVHKYIAGSDIRPKLDSLNKGTWDLKKKRAEKSLEKMIIEISKLYAKRSISKGFAFSKDEELHHLFASDFEYELTEDQKKAIEEIKNDMESDKTMDRLLVGDVGFGKTEVAMQAAFKAVYDGKQVIVLTPTTVLCEQHFITFKNRFDKYGVIIEMFSRLITKSKSQQIIDDFSKKKIDILIATHKILRDDINFSNVGLLIIDEEQRFGVKAKEKIRLLKNDVDTLTMSATPIPRTLYFSLSEIRPISIIQTPPRGRQPIKTYVNVFNPNLVKSAILEELKRGGQVFFIHNNISELEKMKKYLLDMIPNLKILILHGQLSPKEIEKGMIDFKENKYDLLLTTTIIEIGIDLPNVNTLIINEGENFGLSQLHQLRGRIGRSYRQAYAYIFVKSFENLNPEALKRLMYIRQYQELGSGYSLALKDIEIRGIGNLLGTKQWGKVDNIGLGMYLKILSNLVEKIKKNYNIKEETVLELGFFPHIPAEIIPSNVIRQKLYLDIIKTDSFEDWNEVEQFVLKNFSAFYEDILPLLEYQWIKIAATELDIKKIKYHNNFLIFYMKNPNLMYRVLKKMYKIDIVMDKDWVKVSIASEDILKTLKKILKNLV